MPSNRTLVALFAAARLLFGLGLLAKPEKLAVGWIGADGEREPVKVILRGLGARDIALSGGTLASLGDEDRLVPWIAGAMAADLTDVVAVFVAPSSMLPDRSRWGTLALGGGTAAAGGALLARMKR